jgi:hypothetical protein
MTKTASPQKPERKQWQTPRVESSEVFNRAALACCQPVHPIFGFPTGAPTSSGAALPEC